MILMLGGCSKKSDVVITYNTPQDWVNWGNVLVEFTKKTKITAPNDNKNSGQTLTAEKSAPLCDMVYLGISFGPQAVAEDVAPGLQAPLL